MEIYKGKSVFGGIAIGRISVYQKKEQQVKSTKSSLFTGMHWIKQKHFAIFFIKTVLLVRFHLRPLAVSLVRT